MIQKSTRNKGWNSLISCWEMYEKETLLQTMLGLKGEILHVRLREDGQGNG